MGGKFRGVFPDPRIAQKKELEKIIGQSDLASGEKAEALKDVRLDNLEEVAKRFKNLTGRLQRTKQFRKEQTSILTDRPGQRQTVLTQSAGPQGSTGGTLLTGG